MTGIITSSIPGIPDWAVGIAIVVLVGIVIFGGVQSISHVCEKLVPVMAVAYAGGCIVILLMNAPALGSAIGLIFECAFTPKAAFGGAVGSGLLMALQFGCAAACSPTSRALAPPPSSRRPLRRKTPPNRRLSP